MNTIYIFSFCMLIFEQKLDLVLFEGTVFLKTIGYSCLICLIQILLKALGMVTGYTVCSCYYTSLLIVTRFWYEFAYEFI